MALGKSLPNAHIVKYDISKINRASRVGIAKKTFGPGRCMPLDRNAKARVMAYARALTHRTEKGKAYGIITAKMLAVLRYEAVTALERAGLLTWCNRLARIGERVEGLFGHPLTTGRFFAREKIETEPPADSDFSRSRKPIDPPPDLKNFQSPKRASL